MGLRDGRAHQHDREGGDEAMSKENALLDAVNKYLGWYGACDDADTEEWFCGDSACWYCNMAITAAEVEKAGGGKE